MSGPVIVGVDGSASSIGAVEGAAREAYLRGVGLRIVHAFGHGPGHLSTGAPPWNPAEHGLEPMVRGVLARAEERAHAIAPGIEITRSVVAGEALEVLEIESRSASLAVVGSRGLSSFAGLLLGSTAVHLAAHGRCPLMVVRGRPDPAGPVHRRLTCHRRPAEPKPGLSPLALQVCHRLSLVSVPGSAARPASRRATGTRNGEQET